MTGIVMQNATMQLVGTMERTVDVAQIVLLDAQTST